MATKPTIYLDYAAATPLDPGVLKAMEPYFAAQFYNPSAAYLAAKEVAKEVQSARETVAHYLGARSSEVTFTAGGTEANNLAIRGVMEKFPGKHLVVSVIEHDSVLEPAKNYLHSIAPVQPDGRVDLANLKKLITDQTVLVSVMLVNNEIGSIQPIHALAQLIQQIKAARNKKNNNLPLYLHTDACQAANYLDLHVSRLGVDLLTINGGKIYGPKQSGALLIKTGTQLNPQILGGGQENGLRSGTENVAAIIGLSVALKLAQESRVAESKRLGVLRDEFIKLLEQLPQAVVNGSKKYRLPNNVHVTLAGQDNERLMMQLEELGIMCAVGSACSASNDDPSHVLKAIGLSDSEAQASLRFTLGRGTTMPQIQQTVKALKGSLS